MSLVAEFIKRYPQVEGYTLIWVCEQVNRQTKAGVGRDGILRQALQLDHKAEYLVRVCLQLQQQTQE